MAPNATDLWKRIPRAGPGPAFPSRAFAPGSRARKAVSWSGGVLHIAASSRFHAEWLEDKYGPLLQEIAVRIRAGPRGAPDLVGAHGSGALGPPRFPSPQVAETETLPGLATSPPAPRPALNARYTFSRFIVGESNRLAQAASLAVAERPARSYNPPLPLRCHRAREDASHAGDRAPHARRGGTRRAGSASATSPPNSSSTRWSPRSTTTTPMRFAAATVPTTCCSWTTSSSSAARSTRRRSSSTPSTCCTTPVGRSCSRATATPRNSRVWRSASCRASSGGLVADLNPPDYETRVAILRRKAKEDRIFLPPEILDLVARRCRSSVRELEGGDHQAARLLVADPPGSDTRSCKRRTARHGRTRRAAPEPGHDP